MFCPCQSVPSVDGELTRMIYQQLPHIIIHFQGNRIKF